MAGYVIAVAQQKGGAGKTTLAAHLAVHWATEGRRVMALDIDPQGSLTAWHGQRALFSGVAPVLLNSMPGGRPGLDPDRLKRLHDVVLIDCPPHADNGAEMAIRAADLVLVPVQLSPMDLWATGATIEAARREGRALLIVLNRVPPRGHLADKIRAQIAEGRMPLAMQTLGNRQAFATYLSHGGGITEAEPLSAAAAELRALADEVWARLSS